MPFHRHSLLIPPHTAQEMARQNIEILTLYILVAYDKMGEERNELKNELLNKRSQNFWISK